MANKYIRHGATYNGDGLTSSVASGSTVTFTIASPGKVNWTGHGLAANALVYFGVTTAGVLPTGITAGTTYYVCNPGTNDFEISATSGGASINFSGTPSGTASCTTTGAWNHIDIFFAVAVTTITGGTQGGGAIAAGDIIYMRSKSEAGADMTLAAGTAQAIGSGAASLASPITWILDGGTVWSGVDGTLTIDTTSGTATPTASNYIFAENENKIYVDATASNKSTSAVSLGTAAWIRNWSIAGCQTTGTNYGALPLTMANQYSIAENCSISATETYQGAALIRAASNGSYALVINPKFTLPGSGGERPALFGTGTTDPSRMMVIGGYATGNTSGRPLVSGYGTFDIISFQYPRDMSYSAYDNINYYTCRITGADGGVGSVLSVSTGWVDSRDDNNYPKLNARLPNSTASPWSLRAYAPYGSNDQPLTITGGKLYTDTAAAKTITLELAISDDWTTLTKINTYLSVQYIDDTTGNSVTLSSFDPAGGELDSSSAEWDRDTWGVVSLYFKKIVLTTPTAIKKDTVVTFTLNTGAKSTSSTQVAFICPDVQLGAVA